MGRRGRRHRGRAGRARRPRGRRRRPVAAVVGGLRDLLPGRNAARCDHVGDQPPARADRGGEHPAAQPTQRGHRPTPLAPGSARGQTWTPPRRPGRAPVVAHARSTSASPGRRTPTRPVAVVWTSGTTAAPKGAVFDHRNLAAVSIGAGPLRAPFDRRISPTPFSHVGYMTHVTEEIEYVITTIVPATPWKAEAVLAQDGRRAGHGRPRRPVAVAPRPRPARVRRHRSRPADLRHRGRAGPPEPHPGDARRGSASRS